MDRRDARGSRELDRSLVLALTPGHGRTGRAVDALGAALAEGDAERPTLTRPGVVTMAARRTGASQGSRPLPAPRARQVRVQPAPAASPRSPSSRRPPRPAQLSAMSRASNHPQNPHNTDHEL